MNPRKSPQVILSAMMESATRAVNLVDGFSEEDFRSDQKAQAAVSLHLFHLGERASQLRRRFPGFASEHTHLPLRELRGLGKSLVLNYTRVDNRIIWDAATQRLPDLIRQIAPILRDAKTGTGSPAPSSNSEH